MIARMWVGRTRSEDAESYVEVVMETGVKTQRSTPGNRGSWVLHRIEGDEAEFVVISLWDDMESVRSFAGPDVSKARYYEEDRKYLLDMPPTVKHCTVGSARDGG